MDEMLASTLRDIARDLKAKDYDEATTKQSIVLQVLHILGWEVFKADEVVPEYGVESRRVDYSLRLLNRDRVFLEVKKPREELERHQQQLLDYAFRQGVDMAVLTNGLTWWLYLPTKPGDWRQRKFLTVDLREQETQTAAQRLHQFLSKDKVADGSAVADAEKLHKSRLRNATIDATLPEAWNRIISEPDSLLIDLLLEATEKMCGYRPEPETVYEFFRDQQSHITVDVLADEAPRRTREGVSTHQRTTERTKADPKPVANDKPNGRGTRATGTIRVRFDGSTLEAQSIPKLYESVLRTVVDDGRIKRLTLPWGIGTRRYFVTTADNTVHPSGRKFFAPVEYRGFIMESHVNRASGLKYLGALCELLGIDFEIEQY